MEIVELFTILAQGEDSQHEFKKDYTHAVSLAQDMVAFSNGKGGQIFIGVDDYGVISGLTAEDIKRLNELISNAASQHVRPAISLITQNIITENGLVIIVDVPSGINKPYQDNTGVFWVRSGASKQPATSREELQRLFQASGMVHADESPVIHIWIVGILQEILPMCFNKR